MLSDCQQKLYAVINLPECGGYDLHLPSEAELPIQVTGSQRPEPCKGLRDSAAPIWT